MVSAGSCSVPTRSWVNLRRFIVSAACNLSSSVQYKSNHAVKHWSAAESLHVVTHLRLAWPASPNSFQSMPSWSQINTNVKALLSWVLRHRVVMYKQYCRPADQVLWQYISSQNPIGQVLQSASNYPNLCCSCALFKLMIVKDNWRCAIHGFIFRVNRYVIHLLSVRSNKWEISGCSGWLEWQELGLVA